MREVVLEKEFIKLEQVLKVNHRAVTGGDAKQAIQEGLVKVNGEVETQRGRKLYGGEVVTYKDEDIIIRKEA